MGVSLCGDCGNAAEELYSCVLCEKRICRKCVAATGLACPGAHAAALCKECNERMKERIEQKRNKSGQAGGPGNPIGGAEDLASVETLRGHVRIAEMIEQLFPDRVAVFPEEPKTVLLPAENGGIRVIIDATIPDGLINLGPEALRTLPSIALVVPRSALGLRGVAQVDQLEVEDLAMRGGGGHA